MKAAILCSIILVMLLGYMWGRAHSDSLTSCRLTSPMEGTIHRTFSLKIESAQYIVRTENGCSILVTTALYPQYFAGQHVTIAGDVQPLSDIPQEYVGYAQYLDRKEIDGTARFGELQAVGGSPHRSERVRQHIRDTIDRIFPEPGASVAKAMVLGEQGSIPEDISEDFRLTGTSHILAVSGFHIVVLAGLLSLLLLQLPISTYIRAGITLVCLWIYIGGIGFPVSAIRAGIFWSFFVVGLQLRLLTSLASIMLLTTLIMTSIDPTIIQDVGFQLSFMAVAGIGLSLFLFGKDRSGIVKSLIVSVGAFVGTWPIVSFHFGIVSFIGIPLNLVVVPLSGIFLVLAIISILVGFVAVPLGVLVGMVPDVVWKLMFMTVRWGSDFSFGNIEYVVPIWLMCGWYALVILGSTYVVWLQKRSWREIWVH